MEFFFLLHTYILDKLIQRHYLHRSPSGNPHHRFMLINFKFTSRWFLNFTYCIKSKKNHGILRNYYSVRQINIFCPFTNHFPLEDSRSIIIRMKMSTRWKFFLESIHNFDCIHKLYILFKILTTSFPLSPNIIRSLDFLWPLLRT